MDGFSGNSGVIVVAATNRGDILDTALLRPGRFDRRVPVDLPDKDGRVAILRVHCRNKPLADEVDLGEIASRTIGFSGASLQNLMNEAAIMAARRSKDKITFSEIDYAIDRLTVGLAKTTGMNNPARQRLVAYHEAGHGVMAALQPTRREAQIIPRSTAPATLFARRVQIGIGTVLTEFLKGCSRWRSAAASPRALRRRGGDDGRVEPPAGPQHRAAHGAQWGFSKDS